LHNSPNITLSTKTNLGSYICRRCAIASVSVVLPDVADYPVHIEVLQRYWPF